MVLPNFDEVRVGAEIDAKCTRCRLITNHRVVAMVEGVVKRVVCLTCHSQHNYHRPPGEKAPKAARTIRVDRGQKKVISATGTRVFEKWTTLKATLEEFGLEPTPYRVDKGFSAGEPISHAKFGLGFIDKVIPPNKIEVMFDTEIKVLAMRVSS